MPVAGGKARLKWKADFEKNVVVSNFERRGWTRTEGDDWNIFWANVHTVKQIFNPEFRFRLQDDQLINHFPNHYELSRKDLLVKNIKRYIKELQRDGQGQLEEVGHDVAFMSLKMPLGEASVFVPVSYMLPADYSLFVEEFRRCPNAMWIMKPTNKAQGKGIFLINKLAQIKKWSSNSRWASIPVKDTYLISRYIENPLLVGGKKFDLRLYVLVTAYKPMRIYQYVHGFARFCTTKYSTDIQDADNPFIHLTNVSIQKQGEDYNSQHGGKWHVKNLRLFIEATWGHTEATKLFEQIDSLIIHSIRAVQNVMISDRHCFEVYGYDVIIDDALKPWLVEVNASPSLSATTESDRIMKMNLLRDTFAIVMPRGQRGEGSQPGSSRSRCKAEGGYVVLYDEEAEMAAERETEGTPVTRRKSDSWR
ncbi:unnamed protein product [Chrysoparadoxa australica]